MTASPSAARILVADDDAQLCDALVQLLGVAGHSVQTAGDGYACIEAIRAFEPDVLILDLSMPNLDGYGVIREMEVLDLASQPPDVIVLTGHAGVSEGARAIRSGAIGFLTKPARSVELLTLIDRAVAARRALDQKLSAFSESRKHWECSVACQRRNIRHVVNHIAAEIEVTGLIPPRGIRRILMAADEAITNAVVHGGLEVGSLIKERADSLGFEQACAIREAQAGHGDRRVTVALDINPDEVVITIQDQGPGFDVSDLPDPSDPDALLRASGRGIIIMQSLLDEVRFEDAGRRTIMVQRARGTIEASAKQVM